MNIWKLSVLTMIAAVFAVGCANDVGDIDRTEDYPYFDKTDFEGVWFTRSTLIDVPGTVNGVFVGVASNMEKITWEITKDSLIGYQSYEETPGLDSAAGAKKKGVTATAPGLGYGKNQDVFKGRPIVSYAILKHFDIQRGYNSSTGEQTNVISENSSDRNWHERKYIRVNWASESIGFSLTADSTRWIGGEDGEIDGLYKERGDLGGKKEDTLEYFDFTTRVMAVGDEITMRSSFYRLPEVERDYEPAFYDDNMMTKFGYFRTERWVYDRAAGFTDSNIIYLANRHDIWKNDYKRDADGEYLRDARELRIPTPMKDRDPKPVVYYLNENFPQKLLTEEGVLGMIKDYDKAYTRAAAQVKGVSEAKLKETYGDMFVLCHSPVSETDSDVCDPRSDSLKADQDNAPYLARDGDVRRSFIWWVDQRQGAGLLGYGPSYPDPETGELIAGTAYVYGAGVDSYAGSGTDIVRYANGDFTEEELRNGLDKITRNLGQIDPNLDPRGRVLPDGMGDLPIGEMDKLLPEGSRNILDQINKNGFDSLVARPGRAKLIRDTIKESGLDLLMMDDEYIRGISEGELDPSNMTDEQFEDMRNMKNPADLEQIARANDLRRQGFAERNMYMAEFADDAVIGTALEFKGQTDYEEIWEVIRARIFRGVMAHELGHTVGLRHNFQGSWDSMNFFDEYWELRKENFKHADTLDGIYEASEVTTTQAEGGMANYMYSSIMDYHARFNSDTSGLGKYDYAAILFAYTFGTYEDIKVDNDKPVVAEPGFVEVYNTVPGEVTIPGFQPMNAKDFFHSFDDRYAASQHPLTTFHYTAVVDILMGGHENLKDRSIVRYGALRAQQQADDPDRPVEVQYMFGSDEWRGAHMSVETWDLGADALEKTRYYIQNYEEYYPLTHFRRDRATFGIGTVINRAFRTFGAMPQIYQRWIYSGRSGDQVRQLSYQLGALAGLNFLGKVIMMPEYGGYNEDGNGDYQLVSLDPESDADLNIQIGEGRALYSNYETDSGYYWFYRPTEVGNFWDSRYAMLALASNSSTQVLGSATGDFRSFALPYSLVFGDQLGAFVNGLFLDDASFAPQISQDNKVLPPRIIANNFNFLTGAADTGAPKAKIVGRAVFSTRVNALISAVSSFGSANYSKDYIDQARIFKLGNQEQTLPIEALCNQLGLVDGCAAGTHTLEYFVDPDTGIVYGAIQKVGASADLGAQLVARAKLQTAILSSPLATQDAKDNAAFELGSIIEDVVLVSDIVKIFDNVLLN